MLQLVILFILPCAFGQGTTDSITAFKQYLHLQSERLWVDYDYNKNGKFDRQDLQTFIHDYDSDGNGTVSRKEFDYHWSVVEPTLTILGDAIFAEYDDNGDGEITTTDLDSLYKRMDANNDGEVTKPEFKTYQEALLLALFIIQTQHLEGTTPVPSTPVTHMTRMHP